MIFRQLHQRLCGVIGAMGRQSLRNFRFAHLSPKPVRTVEHHVGTFKLDGFGRNIWFHGISYSDGRSEHVSLWMRISFLGADHATLHQTGN